LIEKCKTNEAVMEAVHEGFKPFKQQLVREIVDAEVEKLLQVRIRRISLFDINKHREEMEKTKAELAETLKHIKGLTRYVIGHLETLLEKYGPQYPRLTTKSARHEEVDMKAVAFKSFKVAYDRATGYVGYKVSGDEFKLECTKFDKVLLVFKDGTYKVSELPEKLFVGPELFFCGLPERERVFTCAYTDRNASYLKRFAFGGTILNKAYSCIPEKSRILFFAPETPKLLYVRYKPAPHQKISQQTCEPEQVEVKSPKTRGRQLSIKDISSVTAEPTRGWDEKETTTKIVFV
jgi:topoisomerase-4 subunit A